MRVFLLYCFISLTAFSQTIQFKSSIIDKETKEPVAYANISFLESDRGISSNEDGTFSLEIDKKMLKDKVHISCLNYKDTIVNAFALQNKNLTMQSKNEVLNEVVISKKVDKEFVIDNYKRKNIKSTFGGSQSSPWIVAKYFKYKKEYDKTPYLKEIIVYFGSMLGRKKSKFRIRLFKIDKDSGKPSEDLTRENIIAFSRKVDGKVKINVFKYDIEFPKEGFFVGLERIHIPYNFYEYTYTKNGSRKKYIAKAVAPNFGAVYTKDTINVFVGGKWRKHYLSQDFYKGNSIQPAISVTLSN